MIIRPFFTVTVFVAATDPFAEVLIEIDKAEAASYAFFNPQRASASAAETVA